MTMCAQFGPATDGVDHINIYSRARTAEGKLLSNFTRSPFTLHGMRFESVEGFYQSLLFDEPEERCRIAGLFGKEAKACEKKSSKKAGDPIRLWDGRVVPFESEEFDNEIFTAMREKLRQNPEMAQALLSTEDLPLTHYYVMWGRPLQPRGERGLLVKCMNLLREELRNDREVRQSSGIADLIEPPDRTEEQVALGPQGC